MNLEYAVGLLWVLVFDYVVFELWEGQGGVRGGPRRPRVLGEEFVDYFREKLMCYKRRVGVVGDYDAADAFRTAVGVESVVCYGVLGRNEDKSHFTAQAVPCSSTSCRCPGRVLSATVLLKSVMNSP